MDLLVSEKFWEAVTSLAWPILVAYIFMKLWPTVKPLIDGRKFTIKVGDFEINVADATENIGKQVADIQQKIANIENSMGGVEPPKLEEQLSIQSSRSAVLWVDDYPSNNAFLIDKFQRQGIEIIPSLSTEDALKSVEVREFSAIITDLGRKEDGVEKRFAGLELLHKLREKNINVPVLVFAGDRGLQNRAKLIEAGAQEVTASGADVIRFVENEVLSGR